MGSVVTIATYRHSVAHDREQEEAQARQAREALNANMRMPTTLPNLDKKPEEKAPEKQPEKEPEKPVEAKSEKPAEQSQQQPLAEAPKKEPEPFTFWGYFPAGRGQTAPPGIMFQVRGCSIDKTLVTCIMTATSPRYDRELNFDAFGTTITDSDGDVFRVRLRMMGTLQLDRDSPVPFKLEFPVNKDLVKPIVVRLNGYVPNSGNLQNASFRIGHSEP